MGRLIEGPLVSPQPKDGLFIKLRDPLESSPSRTPCGRLRVAIDVAPISGSIGPHQQSKALDKSVAAAGICVGAANVFCNPRRLSAANDRERDCLDMTMAAPDPIERIGLCPRPGAHVKASRHGLLFVVVMLEKRNNFVTLDQNSFRVGNQQLA